MKRCSRCGSRGRLLKAKDDLPTLCFACWKFNQPTMHVVVLPDGPVPPPNKTITTKANRRSIAIAKATGAPPSKRQRRARRAA